MKKIKKPGKKILTIRLTLLLFAILPLLLTAIILSSVSISQSSKELKSSTRNAMISVVKQIGTAFDETTKANETTMLGFIQSPIVIECLKNPDNAELAAKAQEYTVNFFAELDGWEGIYIADWNSKVITHPAPPVVGRVMREGDSLAALQNSMLSAENGVYNVGIITSPASGELIMSMYAPVYDTDGTPLGYVGGGTYVNTVAAKYSDVTTLNLSSAYVYFVDATGIMLYHPDETKIGNQVENAAVKGVIAKIEAGQHPETTCVEYLYKNAMKYASYYVGTNEAYVAVLTADESEVMANTEKIKLITLILCGVCLVVFSAIAVLVSKKISDDLGKVAKSMEKIGDGDVTAECKADSKIREISGIVESYGTLKSALSKSLSNVKSSAKVLGEAIVNVDEKTSNNVESISQINTAIDEVASTSQTVAESAQVMSEKAVELGNEIEVLSESVSTLYNGTVVIRSANEDAAACMKSVYEGATQSVEAVEDITNKINETNAAVEKIGDALQTIQSIASQTNLLSLNASIEASRAGEAGRGFTIVAQEIRTLADSSAKSAHEIKQIVDEVVSLSNATVAISSKVRSVIDTQQTDIENAQDKFSKLSETVEASVAEINNIKELSEQMDGIKVELSNTTTDLGAISEELGAAAQEVAASCTTVTESCTDTQASTEEMRAINENMSNAIEYFKLS